MQILICFPTPGSSTQIMCLRFSLNSVVFSDVSAPGTLHHASPAREGIFSNHELWGTSVFKDCAGRVSMKHFPILRRCSSQITRGDGNVDHVPTETILPKIELDLLLHATTGQAINHSDQYGKQILNLEPSNSFVIVSQRNPSVDRRFVLRSRAETTSSLGTLTPSGLHQTLCFAQKVLADPINESESTKLTKRAF